MKRFLFVVMLAVFAAAFAGCTSLHPEAPHISAAAKARLVPPYHSYDPRTESGKTLFTAKREAANKAVAEILKIEPAVSFGDNDTVTLAVAEVGPLGVETIRQEDKDAWRTALEKTANVKVIFISSVILSADPDFHELRLAAARLHADVMLLYSVVDSQVHKFNLSSLMYLTLVGAFFTPGDEAAVLTFAKGACFDVRNEFLEFTVEGEDERKSIRPMYFMDTEQMKIDSHKAAVAILRDETVRAIKRKTEK